MTVLAWDGKSFSADRQASAGHMRYTVSKIFKVEDSVLGICGTLNTGIEMKEWFLAGADPKYFPECAAEDEDTELVHITPDGSVFVYVGSPIPFQIEDEVCAFGSGAEAAWAAMLCGADSRKAVEVASRVNSSCGNGIDTVKVREAH